MTELDELFDDAADEAVDLGNAIAQRNPEADVWAIADGIVAGAVHFWLYAHQPQDVDDENDNEGLDTASERLKYLLDLIQQSAMESEYLHSPLDRDVGRA
ncbi:MAG: hypothetical protein AAF446_05280 [Pseudomonadota bacterium]